MERPASVPGNTSGLESLESKPQDVVLSVSGDKPAAQERVKVLGCIHIRGPAHVQLMVITKGIFGFYLLYGYLQERLLAQSREFKLPIFLTLAQVASYSGLAA